MLIKLLAGFVLHLCLLSKCAKRDFIIGDVPVDNSKEYNFNKPEVYGNNSDK